MALIGGIRVPDGGVRRFIVVNKHRVAVDLVLPGVQDRPLDEVMEKVPLCLCDGVLQFALVHPVVLPYRNGVLAVFGPGDQERLPAVGLLAPLRAHTGQVLNLQRQRVVVDFYRSPIQVIGHHHVFSAAEMYPAPDNRGGHTPQQEERQQENTAKGDRTVDIPGNASLFQIFLNEIHDHNHQEQGTEIR